MSLKPVLSSPAFLFFGFLPLMQARSGIPWWVWLLIIIVLLIVLYLLLRGSRKTHPQVEEALPQRTAEILEEPIAKVDDLSVIEGIGPKINQILHESGIQSFQQLADADTEEIDRILDQANLRLADPGTWGEQARLAAAGEWEALKKLQDALKGGRAQ